MTIDYYEILQVNKHSTFKEIKQSYKKLAIKYHPDKNSDSDSDIKMKEINEAYTVLGDEVKRKNYDRFGLNNFNMNNHRHPNPMRHPFENMFGNTSFENFSFTIKREGGTSHFSFNINNRSVVNLDVIIEVNFTLQEVMIGGKKEIKFNSIGKEETITLNFPKGFNNNARMKINGKGKLDRITNRRGDLIIKPKLIQHPEYKQSPFNELDLIIEKTINKNDKQVEIKSPDENNTYIVKIPENLPVNGKMKLNRLGIPSPNPRLTGNIIIIITYEN